MPPISLPNAGPTTSHVSGDGTVVTGAVEMSHPLLTHPPTSTAALPQTPGFPSGVACHPINGVNSMGQVATHSVMPHTDTSSVESMPPAWHALDSNEG
ncbi:hypothetical protein FBUS_01730 [Fasciolopsis buskii]|uniref:Uncharacterized protein n=1 Tax=Fasciolopsis buskii TaxID=27845 RepID=A0A8E0S4B8_9TREM|nr:hypothetical protein FBUS_01730 [Fasciolopsis buski]